MNTYNPLSVNLEYSQCDLNILFDSKKEKLYEFYGLANTCLYNGLTINLKNEVWSNQFYIKEKNSH